MAGGKTSTTRYHNTYYVVQHSKLSTVYFCFFQFQFQWHLSSIFWSIYSSICIWYMCDWLAVQKKLWKTTSEVFLCIEVMRSILFILECSSKRRLVAKLGYCRLGWPHLVASEAENYPVYIAARLWGLCRDWDITAFTSHSGCPLMAAVCFMWK